MEVIKNKRVLAAVGVVGLILSIFLPYFKLSILGYTKTIALWGYWEGKVVFVLTLANALFIFQDFIERYIPQLFNNWVGKIVQKVKNPKFALVPTILVAVFAISLIIRIDVDSEYIKYGLGFYVLWLGIISLIGHAILYKENRNISVVSNKSDLQQIVQPVVELSDQVVQQPVIEPSEQQIAQQYQTQPSKKYCPNCGNQLDASAETCFMCGTKF